MTPTVGFDLAFDETGIRVALREGHGEAERGLEATVAAAGSTALATVTVSSPVRLGTLRSSWRLQRDGALSRVVASSDHPPKVRRLEQRYRFLARGKAAADRVVSAAYPEYRPAAVSLEPLW